MLPVDGSGRPACRDDVLRGDHPCHLAIWGKTGTGKTLTLSFFLNLLAEMARAKNVPVRHEHLDLSTPRPCFRALNDLACLFNASKRYKKGISPVPVAAGKGTTFAGRSSPRGWLWGGSVVDP